jgi:uncharacterized membrane protein
MQQMRWALRYRCMANKSTQRPSSAVRENIRAIADLEERFESEIPRGERFADLISTFVGSISFVLVHLAWFGGWIIINTGLVPGIGPFDPFPFQLLNVLVSLEAILIATFVLIKQNRMSRQSDRRGHLDLQINLLVEKESTKILQILDRMARQQGLSFEDPEIQDLKKSTALDDLAQELDEKVGGR